MGILTKQGLFLNPRSGRVGERERKKEGGYADGMDKQNEKEEKK